MKSTAKQLHSLFLSAWYPNRDDAMSGLFVRKHAEAVGLFCKVTVLYVHSDPAIRSNEIIIQDYHQVKEILVYYPGGKTTFRRILKPLRFLLAYVQGINLVLKNEGKPSLTHVNILTRSALPALFLKLLYRIPFVVTEHWSRYLPSRNSYHGILRKWITRIIVREAAFIMPVSEDLREAMQMHGLKNQNYQVINNVVEDFFFKTLTTAKKINEKKHILHISCFDDEPKNITGMLRAVKELSKDRTDFVFTIAGTGKDELKIKNLFMELNFPEGMILFTGELTPFDIASEFAKTDFFVLFSTNENAPVVISESLACGKPVVSTNVGGIPEMLDSSNSILINPKDEKALKDALNTMLDHYQEYDAQKIRSDAYPKYSYEMVGKTIVERYKLVLNQHLQ